MAEPKNSTPTASSAFSITSLVTGITGLVFIWAPLFGFVLSVLAIIFGGIALKKQFPSKGMAIAGLITGIVGVAIVIFVCILVLAGISLSASTPDYYYNY